MKILLTNDDGINSEGIQSLYGKLKSKFETYIIAPDRERSACSNIFTVRDELRVTKTGSNVFSINGFPADCVSIGLHSGLIPEIDLVVSGINHGPNLGDDVHFSGTVAAARTACIFGKPGIAFSSDTFHRPSVYFDQMGDYLCQYIENEYPFKGDYININYPDLPADKVKGTMYTSLSKRFYRDRYIIRQQDSDSEFSMILDGSIETRSDAGSDSDALNNGYISITPLTIDTTDYHVLQNRKQR